MNKMLRGLILGGLVLSVVPVDAYTNKTFLMPRSHGVDLPMEYTTFNELINRKSEKSWGFNLAATGFYQASTKGDEQAKYFLIHNKNVINVPLSATQDAFGNPINATSTVTNDIDFGYINHAGGQNAAAADLFNLANNLQFSLNPEQKAYGVTFDYHQDLSCLLSGLYFSAHMPVVHVENNVGRKVISLDPDLRTAVDNFFQGTEDNTDATTRNLYSKLANAKWGNSMSKTEVADIDLRLGYKFLDRHSYSLSFAFAVTIPTGNKATGQFLFEPIGGNGDHIGVGGDMNAHLNLWGRRHHHVKLNAMAKYRYLLENDEMRTLGIKGRDFGQYTLLGKNSALANQPLIPAANVLTLPVDVTPGHQFDGILGLAYNYHWFSFDLGYNLYMRETEDVFFKGTFPANTYAIAARGFATTNPFNINVAANIDGGNVNPAPSIISNNNIDVGSARTSSQITHSIYGGLGAIVSKCGRAAVMLSGGGKYEWSDRNSALEQWNAYGKLGVSF